MSKPTEIRAEATGSLASVEHHSDSIVLAGDVVGQLECMKVYMDIHATADGVIKWHKSMGQFVQEDELLAEIFEVK